jgi:hypothetical protein
MGKVVGCLTTVSASRLQLRILGWLFNDEFERIWKEAVVAWTRYYHAYDWRAWRNPQSRFLGWGRRFELSTFRIQVQSFTATLTCFETCLTFWRLNFFYIIHNNSVRTSQETHYVSAAEPNRLMLFVETVAVYCENHTEHTNTLPNNI